MVLVFPTLQEELALSAQEQRAEKEKQAKHKARDPVKREFTITIKIMLLLFRVLLLFKLLVLLLESFGGLVYASSKEEEAAKKKEEEERDRLKADWLNLLFTDQSVAAMSPEAWAGGGGPGGLCPRLFLEM